ncbi:MAG: DUF4920 domain-containing protein [Pseudomonadota bacterium]
MRILMLPLLLLVGIAVAEEPLRLSEPVEVTSTHEVFGAPLPDKSDGVRLASLIEGDAASDGEAVRVTTRIAKVCQKKGCFFIAQDGDVTARVSFADYGFFVPTDSSGKDVTLVGTFSRTAVSRNEADHLAEDLGEEPSQALAAAFEYSIVATSVLIPRS